jgi:hypothetical protein
MEPATTTTSSSTAAATQVFNLPELLELILLNLSDFDTTHEEIRTIRFIYTSRTVSRTWHTLLNISPPLRQMLNLPNPLATGDAKIYNTKTAFPPARPNPWIPHVLLNQRSWGTAYPFDNSPSVIGISPTEPKYWTFSFEISRAQYDRLPYAGQWRDMLAANPPFTSFWYTRCFYELGSGRAPFVTHLDYDPKLPKARQRYRKEFKEGVTLGMLVDAVRELFGRYPDARFVMVESLRAANTTTEGAKGESLNLEDDRPVTKACLPGSSAEREWGFQREVYQS